MTAVEQVATSIGAAPACRVLGVSRAALYRGRRPAPVVRPRPASPRALDPVERQAVLDVLHTRFVDQAPAQVHAALLDEGAYLCSPRTMYRVLDAAHEVKERRNQVRRPHYAVPELLATRANEVWSWDITKLLGPAKWTYFYLYVILDIFSRYVVGWMLAPRENAALAERLIAETCAKHDIQPGQLRIHADRGGPMRSKPVALLLADLGRQRGARPRRSPGRPHDGCPGHFHRRAQTQCGRLGQSGQVAQPAHHRHHHRTRQHVGPTFPELVDALPGVDIIDRATVNAFDDVRVSHAIDATGRKKLIFAGISLEICAAFPAITAVGKGLDAYVAVDACGTFSQTKREVGLLRMLQAGVVATDYASLMVEILKDNSRPDAVAIYGAIDMPWAKLVGTDRSGVRQVGHLKRAVISE